MKSQNSVKESITNQEQEEDMSQDVQSESESQNEWSDEDMDQRKGKNNYHIDDQQQKNYELEQQRRKQLNQITPQQYMHIYEKKHVPISTLSVTKYNKIQNSKNFQVINPLPDLGRKLDQRNKMPFVSFKDIKYINKNIIQALQEENEKSILSIKSHNSNKTIKNKSHVQASSGNINMQQYISPKARNLDKQFFSKQTQSLNNSIVLNKVQDGYTKRQLIDFELQHNKDSTNILSNINNEQLLKRGYKTEKVIKTQEKLLNNQPKPKIYDTKHYKKVQNRKKQQELDKMQEQFSKSQNIKQININLKQQSSPKNKTLKFLSNNTSKPTSSRNIAGNGGSSPLERSPKSPKSRQKVSKQVSFNKSNMMLSKFVQDVIETDRIKQYDTIWYEFTQHHWRPNVRENAALTKIGQYVYLYGGLGVQDTNNICILDIKTLKWQILQNQYGDKPKYSRFAHVALNYKKLLIIFGGFQRLISDKGSSSEVILDMRFFNTESLEWKKISPQGDFIQPRRNFTAQIFGKHIIAHGGINNRDQYINDLWVFDLQNLRWSQAICEEPIGFVSKGVAFHSSCSVFNYERRSNILYRTTENTADKITKIKTEGIYFFGGKSYTDYHQKNEDNLEIQGQLMILKIDQKPMQWEIPETFGITPCPRYSSTMVFNPLLELMFLYGGRNESQNISGFLQDCHVLKLETMTWYQVNQQGKYDRPPRAAHCSFSHDTRMYIFGGYNTHGFCTSDMEVMELDPQVTAKLSKDLKLEQKYQQKQMELQQKKELKQSEHKETITEKMIKKWMDSDEYDNYVDSPTKKRNFKEEMAKKLKKDLTKLNDKNLKYQQNYDQSVNKLIFNNSITYNPMPAQKTIAQKNIDDNSENYLDSSMALNTQESEKVDQEVQEQFQARYSLTNHLQKEVKIYQQEQKKQKESLLVMKEATLSIAIPQKTNNTNIEMSGSKAISERSDEQFSASPKSNLEKIQQNKRKMEKMSISTPKSKSPTKQDNLNLKVNSQVDYKKNRILTPNVKNNSIQIPQQNDNKYKDDNNKQIKSAREDEIIEDKQNQFQQQQKLQKNPKSQGNIKDGVKLPSISVSQLINQK